MVGGITNEILEGKGLKWIVKVNHLGKETISYSWLFYPVESS